MNEEQDIKELQDVQKNYITWQQFIWFVGILTLTIGYVNVRISILENKVVDSQLSYVKIETQLTQIQKDISEININFEKHLEQK